MLYGNNNFLTTNHNIFILTLIYLINEGQKESFDTALYINKRNIKLTEQS